jgi:hypothetical protein
LYVCFCVTDGIDGVHWEEPAAQIDGGLVLVCVAGGV